MTESVEQREAGVAPAKGDLGGECNRRVCTNTPARWFNRSTLKHYCGSCARTLNAVNHNDAQRLFGGSLCVIK